MQYVFEGVFDDRDFDLDENKKYKRGAYYKGDKVEKIFKMINFNTEEAISRFAKKLRNMGVDEELEKLGVEEGDTIKILDYEFEYTK